MPKTTRQSAAVLHCGLFLLLGACASRAGAHESDQTVAVKAVASDAPAAVAKSTDHQYTFAWRFADDAQMQPRGGTSKGAPVVLDTEPGAAWTRLHESGLDKKERDRRAILAMAGGYRASFDFIEVAGFTADYKPDKPYQSWGTENVVVLADTPDFISLQHVLVMVMLDADGKPGKPMAMKHWRQDWVYQPHDQLVYRGRNTWETVAVDSTQRRGAWRQSVWQVDDSPRYSGVGQWQHQGNYSSWTAEEGWRPRPRREFSVRDDYQVLSGSNRHTITPTGWIHEQQNNKLALGADGQPSADSPILAREFGLNRYERLKDFDFAAGDVYLKRSGPLWSEVRAAWDDIIARHPRFTLRAAPDQDQLFMPLFELAGTLAGTDTPRPAAELKTRARKLVGAYLADDDSADGKEGRY